MLTNQEVKKIVEELCGSAASLFPQNKVEAILFGSYARGDAEPGSDIDVLTLVDASRQDISARNWQVGDLAAELLLDYGIVVSPIVENRSYFTKNVDALPFYRNVKREGVCLVHDITRIDLSRYRLQKAKEMLVSARRDMDAEA